jgi:NADPH2:quinone reductase
VPRARVLRLPPGVDPQLAAAGLLQGLTALTLIRESAGIGTHLGVSEGPWVLVHAAAGGVGSHLVQMLSTRGVKVIASAGSAEKCELAKKYGAHWVVNSREEDVVARVKEITSGHGVDVIFDGVGKATFEGDLEMVARKGSLVMFGNAVSTYQSLLTDFEYANFG